MFGRLPQAWAVLRGQKLPDQRPTSHGIIPMQLGAYQIDRRQTADDQLNAYRGWVAACVNVLSSGVRQQPWFLCRDTGPDPEDIEKLELDQVPEVLKMPSLLMDLGTLLELSVKHLDTTGSMFWYLVTRTEGDPTSEVLGIQPLYPQQVLPHYNDRLQVFDAWEVRIAGQPQMTIPHQDVVWTYRPHPSIPWLGASPIEQVALTVDLDLYAKAYGVAMIEGGGMPPGILSMEQKVTPEQAEAVKARWKNQRADPDDIAVIGNGASFEQVGTSLKDLAWLDLARMNRDEVLAIYQVPSAKLGLIEDVNRANAVDVNRAFAADALRPRLRMIEDSMNRYVLPRLGVGPDVFFRFENPVDQDMALAVSRANAAYDRGAITVNEYRKETNRDEIEGGDVYSPSRDRPIRADLAPREPAAASGGFGGGGGEDAKGDGQIPEVEKDDSAEARALPAPGEQEIIGIDLAREGSDVTVYHTEPVELGLEGLTGDEVISTLQARSLLPEILPLSDREMRAVASTFENIQDRMERDCLRRFRALLGAEQSRVVKEIRSRKRVPKISSRGVFHADFEADCWEFAELGLDGTERLIYEDVIEFEQTAAEVDLQRDLLSTIHAGQTKSWSNAWNKMLRDGFVNGWNILREEAGRDLVDVGPVLEKRRASILRQAEIRVRRFRKTTRRQIARGIRNLIRARKKEGLDTTPDDVAEEVSRIYDQAKSGRAQTVCRTETSFALNDGKNRHMKMAERRLDVTFIKTWNAILDEHTRPGHTSAHGQEREVNDEFVVSGEALRHPLDPRGSAGNIINCRCTMNVQMKQRRKS